MLKPVMLLSASVLLAIAPASVSGRAAQEAAPAQAPAPAAQAPAPVKGPMALDAKSPVTPTTASLAEAKAIYNRDCALCHGNNGNGKTDVATSMNLTLSDWTDPKSLAGKQDGALFNMIRVGNSKMPGEDAGRAKDNVVWNLIYYIRDFSKTQAAAPPSATTTPEDMAAAPCRGRGRGAVQVYQEAASFAAGQVLAHKRYDSRSSQQLLHPAFYPLQVHDPLELCTHHALAVD